MPASRLGHLSHITVAGHPRERGLGHGHLLAAEIAQALDVYLRFLDQPQHRIVALAEAYRQPIAEFAPDFAVEIEAIAEGAQVPPWQSYLLNARTEMPATPAPECTALYFRESRLLGQNWGWLEPLEPLCVMATVLRVAGPSDARQPRE